MFKVIIVDDEASIRRTIFKIGQWEERNIRVAGEASNGQEAYQLIENLKPDLIIMDMHMPGIDGIELMSMLKKSHASSKVIVVSGYEDFKYTKQAITHGAIDYILKPINRMELNRALQKAVSIMQEESAAREVHALSDVHASSERRTWVDWLKRSSTSSMMDIGPLLAPFQDCAVSIGIIALVQDNGEFSLIEEEHVSQQLAKLSEHISNVKAQLIRLSPSHNVFIVLTSQISSSGITTALHSAAHEDLMRRLSFMLERSDTGIKLFVGNGEIYTNPRSLPSSFKCALTALNRHNLFNSEGNADPPAEIKSNWETRLRSLKWAILGGQASAVHDFIDRYIHEIFEIRHWTNLELQRIGKNLISIIESATWSEGINTDNLHDEMEDITLTYNASYMAKRLIAFANQVDQSLQQHTSSSKNDTISLIRMYLEEHFAEETTLQSVARKFYLNKDYLSRAFKERYSVNLTSFIHQIRCEKAKELLQQGMNVQEAAEKVGFTDTAYFSKLFKRYTGLSPKAFIRT